MSRHLKGFVDNGGDHSSLTPFTPFTQAHVVEMFCQQCHASIGGPRSSWPLGVNIKCCDLEDAAAL